MKNIALFIFLLLITYSLSDVEYDDECESTTDRSKCQSVKKNEEGWSCYPVEDETNENLRCSTFPDFFFKYPKLFYQVPNGIEKELASAEADIFDEEDKKGENLELSQLVKDSYTKGETIQIKKLLPTSDDLKILNSKQTCSYYLYGRFYGKELTEYPDISDKSTCFNAKQFSDLSGIIDCGYATITFTTPSDKYTIKTCYFYEGKNMPSEFKDSIHQSFYSDDFDDPEHGGLLALIFYLIDYPKHPEKYNEKYDDEKYDDEGRRRRRLSDISVDMTVEDKNGNVHKYSVSNRNDYDDNHHSSKSAYNKINYLILMILILLY